MEFVGLNDLPEIAAIIAVVGGVMAYCFKKYIDYRINLEFEKLKMRFEALARIKGMLAELDHSLNHVHKGDKNYEEDCREWCMRVRKEVRANIAYVGKDIKQLVHDASDIALQYLDDNSSKLKKDWNQSYLEIMELT